MNTPTMLFDNCCICGFDTDGGEEIDGSLYCRHCKPDQAETVERCGEQFPHAQAPANLILRPYQQEAVDSVFTHFQTSNSTLIVMPTGVGKTICFAAAAHRAAEHGRVLVVAHRDELIQQAADKIHRFTGLECDIEMGDRFADQCIIERRCPVLVTSVQTMSRPRRMERFHPEEFVLVIIDEAHHVGDGSGTYGSVIRYYRNSKVLGVSATPDRLDEVALGKAFQTVAYDYKIIQAIDDGWLVPIEQQFIQVEGLDLSTVRTTGGDLNQGDLSRILEQEKILHGYADPTIRISDGRKTLVFAASVNQAEQLAGIFNRHKSESARWICGDSVRCPMETRRETLRDFTAGKFQLLVNCAVLLEGYDEPTIEVVAVCRPTKSRSLYTQMVGRGTRPLGGLVDGLAAPEERCAAIAASEKRSLVVLDFVGNSGRHKLMHTGDILGADFDDDVVGEATRAVGSKNSKGERADMLAALREAEANKKKRLADRARVRVGTKFTATKIDPFGLWDMLPHRESGYLAGKPPTEQQRAKLEKMGAWTDKLRYTEAQQILDEAEHRRKCGLCTYKQGKLLARHHFNPNVGSEQAGAIIDKIVKSGWKLRGNWHGETTPPAAVPRPAPTAWDEAPF